MLFEVVFVEPLLTGQAGQLSYRIRWCVFEALRLHAVTDEVLDGYLALKRAFQIKAEFVFDRFGPRVAAAGKDTSAQNRRKCYGT